MSFNLGNEFNEAREAFLNSVQNNEPEDKQAELYGDMVNQIAEEAKRQARQETESVIATNPAEAKMSARERKFFNEIDTNVGYKEDTLLPQETFDRIFEDLTTEHPLLSKIGLRNAGLRMKFLKSETEGVAVWGKIFGEIKGQLDAAFSEEETIQNKLTAFVVIPKDLQDYNVSFIEEFVRTQINEAFAVALEAAFVSGDGDDKPIGLNRDINNGSTSGSTTTYPEKDTEGELTFADPDQTVNELTDVYKFHSVKENGHPLAVEGRVSMIVNPSDLWNVKKQYTSLNAQGTYVTALPYNLDIVESVAQETGKVTTFVQGRYDAFLGGGMTIRKYDQTLAIEDMDLYTAKQMAYGKAKDIKATAVWTLNVSDNGNDESPQA
ncbi:phage major capsid protein [Tetragenococcus halophilus]|uniref:Phage major capsid protein n=1 Tax=Tetragenococcus halophilus TaxID=51669 RepID=A0AB35HQR0_TETHA|nr:phage major capsid protein [Tetragenococcus halophilus]MCO8298643.1 phage major capsid protein [Tetragenococcus halophilus]